MVLCVARNFYKVDWELQFGRVLLIWLYFLEIFLRPFALLLELKWVYAAQGAITQNKERQQIKVLRRF